MMIRTFSLLLTLCLLLASIPMVQAGECSNGGVHEITADGTYTVAFSEPTCTEAGMAEYTCTACGDVFSKVETKPAAGHDQLGSLSVFAATCTEPETEYITCSKCGTLQIHDTYGEPLGHHYLVTARTAASCTADGSITYTCDREGCSASYTETLTSIGHDYQETARTNATCTADGSVTYMCTREGCGASYTIAIYAKGHNITTSDGYTYTCTRCGLTEVDEDEKTKAEATPVPEAYGTVNEAGDLTDLTLTSAIKQAGGGYSLRRKEATLGSITLASEKDPENAWMRLTASEPAKQLGMQASYISNQITLTLTENDQELTITGASLDGHVLTITTSSGAVFELSTLNVSLGYTDLTSIAEKNLDRIIFSRSGSVLMIDFGSAETMKAEEAATLTLPDETSLPTATPAPTSASKITITFSRRTITTATPAPELVIIATPEPVVMQEEETIIEIQTDAPIIIIYPCESEETVVEYQRSNCSHKWVYEEGNGIENRCQFPRTCELCGMHEEIPSSHCWYVKNGNKYADDGNGYLLACLYCGEEMEESSLNQAQGFCMHPHLSESYFSMPSFVGQQLETKTSWWCDTAMTCPDCQKAAPPIGHNWKITEQDGDYYKVQCTRCGKTASAHKKFYNDATGKLDISAVSCADDPSAHQWTVLQSNDCKRTLLCANCGKQVEMDHDWQSTKDGCHYTAVCSVCGKTEKATIHACIMDGYDFTGKHIFYKWWQIKIYLKCTSCNEIIKSSKFYVDKSDYLATETKKYTDKLRELCGGQETPIYPSNVPFYFSEEYIQGE